MDRRNATRSIPIIGTSSLLVIFAVLCLTVFALLSVSSAQADARLGDAAAEAVIAYYEADTQAEEILARLRAGESPDGVSEQNGVYTYRCPISRTQSLEVAVRLEQDAYTILRWQAVSTTEWQADERLDVWDGEEG